MTEAGETEEDPTLSVGVIVGGAFAAKEWRNAVTQLAERLLEMSDEAASHDAVALNVIYQIPGEVMTPDFEGVRTGRYSKSKARLIVQVALPEEVPDDPERVVREYLDQAIGLAESFLLKKGIPEERVAPYSQIASTI